MQELSLAWRYLYDPVAQTVYHYLWNPARGVYALAFATSWVPAPKVVNVRYTQKLRVIASFNYTGPAFSGLLYGAIGRRVLTGFDELVSATSPLSLSEALTPVAKTATVDIPITDALPAGENYSIYVKIIDEAGRILAISDYLENAVHVVEVVPEFTEFKIIEYTVV